MVLKASCCPSGKSSRCSEAFSVAVSTTSGEATHSKASSLISGVLRSQSGKVTTVELAVGLSAMISLLKYHLAWGDKLQLWQAPVVSCDSTVAHKVMSGGDVV